MTRGQFVELCVLIVLNESMSHGQLGIPNAIKNKIKSKLLLATLGPMQLWGRFSRVIQFSLLYVVTLYITTFHTSVLSLFMPNSGLKNCCFLYYYSIAF